MRKIAKVSIFFLCCFQIIPPSENTTFNVVLLGREEGEIETNLYIHTSEGIFKFKVSTVYIVSIYINDENILLVSNVNHHVDV